MIRQCWLLLVAASLLGPSVAQQFQQTQRNPSSARAFQSTNSNLRIPSLNDQRLRQQQSIQQDRQRILQQSSQTQPQSQLIQNQHVQRQSILRQPGQVQRQQFQSQPVQFQGQQVQRQQVQQVQRQPIQRPVQQNIVGGPTAAEIELARKTQMMLEQQRLEKERIMRERQQQQGNNQQQHVQEVDNENANDDDRLLSLPIAELCAERPKQWQHGDHWYFYSADFPEWQNFTAEGVIGKKYDWLDARNECRLRCMDAVSMETPDETEMIFANMTAREILYIWTSGRLCDFKGCDRPDLKPLNVKGWFWSGSGRKMAHTNVIPEGWTFQPWSQTGHFKRAQPDNAEYSINETSESCLGVLNNIYKDGVSWHDIACYHQKPVICEDNDVLLKYIRDTNPGIVL